MPKEKTNPVTIRVSKDVLERLELLIPFAENHNFFKACDGVTRTDVMRVAIGVGLEMLEEARWKSAAQEEEAQQQQREKGR